MNRRQINQALWTLAAVLAAGAAIALAVGLMLPLGTGDGPTADQSRAAGDPRAPSLPQLASLEPLWNLRLRAEVLPTEPPAEQAPPPRLAADTTAGVPMTLVGTIGDSLAMLRDASGAVELKAVGESAGGVEVLEVRPARVRVRYNGQVHTLQRPPEAQGGI